MYKGIAFYPDIKFLISEEEIEEKINFLTEDNIEKIYEKRNNIAYTYTNNNIVFSIYNDSLMYISDKQYNESDWSKSRNRIIKLANLIMSVLNWTSIQNINNSQDNSQIYIHSKEITTLNIVHVQTKDDLKDIEYISASKQAGLEYLKQKSDKNFFYQNNSSAKIYSFYDFKRFGELVSKNLDYIFNNKLDDIVFMLYRSSLEVRKSNFDISIILSFFVIEKMVNLIWIDLLKEKSLKKKLKENRDYTVSIKSNVLYMNGKISREELDKIDKARQYRNSIAHEKLDFNDRYTFEEIFSIANESFNTACKIFSKYFDIDFKLEMQFIC